MSKGYPALSTPTPAVPTPRWDTKSRPGDTKGHRGGSDITPGTEIPGTGERETGPAETPTWQG